MIDPTPPSDVDETEMTAIVADYRSGMSIRACADGYALSFGTIRRVLIYKRVELRSPGERRRARS